MPYLYNLFAIVFVIILFYIVLPVCVCVCMCVYVPVCVGWDEAAPPPVVPLRPP